MIKRIWDSPTLMTWLSYSTRTLSLFGVLPLILKRFSPGDIVLWYLFSTIIALQSIADFGFRQTFSRIISFAFGGAKDVAVFNDTKPDATTTEDKSGPNKALLTSIVSTMKFIYVRLTIICLALLVTLGTWSMYKPVQDASDVHQAWWSWIIVVAVSCVGFYGKIYLNFLEGLNKIAVVRRVETLTSIGTILTSIVVLLVAPTLLNLVIANQIWVIIVTLRDWYLCSVVDNKLYTKVSHKQPFDKNIFLKIWQPAWRSGVSGFMSVGLTNLTGLVYAQIGSTVAVASYLLSLRIINQIKDISMAPFYSKLPTMAILRVKNDNTTLTKVAQKGMFVSHIVYVAGIIIVGLFSGAVLKMLHTQVGFVTQNLWILLGVAFFVHRYGAMHIQLYNTTNHILAHIADGVSGIIYIISAIVLTKYIGIYSIPVGMLMGYLGFYSWYAAYYSIKSVKSTFFKFEKATITLPIMAFVMYIAFALIFKIK